MEQVGNYEEARGIINKIQDEYRHVSYGYLYPALYYNKLKNYKLSKKILREGIENFPDSSDLYLTLAFILKETERWNESIKVLKSALSRSNLQRAKSGIEKQDIWNELGHLYYERGNYNSCIACLKKAIFMKGDNFSCYGTIARAYLNVGDPGNSIRYLDLQYSRFQFLNSPDFITKARAYSRLKDYEEAERVLEMAYRETGTLILSSEEMVDFSELTKKGFFLKIENFEIDG